MAQIGIKRFTTRHDEEHSAKRHKADDFMFQQKGEAVIRIDRSEHAPIITNMENATGSECEKPKRRDRTKEARDRSGAMALHSEEANQNR